MFYRFDFKLFRVFLCYILFSTTQNSLYRNMKYIIQVVTYYINFKVRFSLFPLSATEKRIQENN